MGWRTERMVDSPQSMNGFKIHCFECDKDIQSKSELPKSHKGHSVGWVRKSDGE